MTRRSRLWREIFCEAEEVFLFISAYSYTFHADTAGLAKYHGDLAPENPRKKQDKSNAKRYD